ncbi:UbiH/UbiF family hydroxylase [Rhodobacter capsulatus]|uniref:UbiH/UbiF family hydroxylase n=1 Tax=Rhodobacter capsulatus TaxID=1061 RepID=UPI0006DD3058|nr:UbiH/UbiF family hydroxylase [Rhodobacter capsulatus]KQB11996.1 2-octaprenyl-6-methoxyphenyl hydroxylase [Rhodobacter capsulatus]PZX23817.1 2-octaprenyl-6-methoxyphenol hydroxylase [Rhodobacter capsulatus]QNR62242.1 UbiH/UbiF family hydroxylase [Rhodobacter capsulatus]
MTETAAPPRLSTDILISGGGVAGLTAAAAFGAAGFTTICVDPEPPVTAETDAGADMRTTAFLHPSRAVLERAGLWARLAPHAAPLQVMRIIDAGGARPEARIVRDFDAADISDEPFGWNFPNWLLRREMVARLAEIPQVDFRPGVATVGLLTRESGAEVRLSDGTLVTAKLVIGADGRNSFVREAAGIGTKTTHYGQKALVCAVTHPSPHGNVSTEVHRTGGPFTLVPLPDRDGKPSSAIVWMERGPEAERLAALDPADFEREMTERSTGVLGPLTLATRRALWPMITQIACRFSAERVALIAEAAHVIPPIGAQGLNMSLADLRCLLDLAEKDPAHLGGAAMLASYNRRRWPEVKAREVGIDFLNRASMVAPRPLRDLRAAALGALYAFKPVRKTLMRAGLGMR